MAAMVSLAGYIFGQMKNNSKSTLTGQISIYNAAVITIPVAMVAWYSMVKAGAPWDHKPPIRKLYGTWSYDDISLLNYRYDIWSNVHYGYVGLAAGFSAYVLKSGAGAAQIQDDSTDTDAAGNRIMNGTPFLEAFDDPADQAAIDIGATLWDEFDVDCTLNNLLDLCRERSGDLNTSAATGNIG